LVLEAVVVVAPVAEGFVGGLPAATEGEGGAAAQAVGLASGVEGLEVVPLPAEGAVLHHGDLGLGHFFLLLRGVAPANCRLALPIGLRPSTPRVHLDRVVGSAGPVAEGFVGGLRDPLAWSPRPRRLLPQPLCAILGFHMADDPFDSLLAGVSTLFESL